MKKVYNLDKGRIYLDDQEILAFVEPHRKEMVDMLVKKGWIPERFLIPMKFEEAESLTQGKVFKVELQKIKDNISLFFEKRNNYSEEKLRQKIMDAFCEALNEERPEKFQCFYLLIPEKEWVYRDKDELTGKELCDFAEKVRGYTAEKTEIRLAFAMMIIANDGSEEVWNLLAEQEEKKESILLERDNEKVNLAGGNEPLATIRSYKKEQEYRESLPCVVLQSLHTV